MSAIDLDGFRSTPLCHDPYDHLIVPGFLKADAIGAIDADYPHIAKAGSFPVSELDFGPAFAALVEELQNPGVAEAFADKFGVALDGRPTTITVRGRCRARDGRIHTDTDSKIITVLIYMNAAWEEDGGRLRVLRSGDDLDDFTAEVPPIAGTLLAFRRSATSFHGHPPFVGERRVVQLNWVTDEDVVRREHRRHRFTARLKKIFPFG
jgi:hypothetical protein